MRPRGSEEATHRKEFLAPLEVTAGGVGDMGPRILENPASDSILPMARRSDGSWVPVAGSTKSSGHGSKSPRRARKRVPEESEVLAAGMLAARISKYMRPSGQGRVRIKQAIGSLKCSDRNTGKLLGADHVSVGKWRAGRHMQMESLARLGAVTGYSIDWLCGFDVPQLLAARTHATSIASGLRTHLRAALRRRGIPPLVTESWLSDGPELLEEVVAHFEELMRFRQQQEAEKTGLMVRRVKRWLTGSK